MHHRSARAAPDVPEPCDTCVVRDTAICARLPVPQRGALASLRRLETLRSGETFAWEGEASVLVAILRNGVFKRSLMLSDGREQVVGLAFPGDMVGRLFDPTSDHSLTAITDARLCVFPRAAFERFMAENPVLDHALLVQALEDLSRAQRQMLRLARLSAPQRVATFLLELVDRSIPDPDGRIAIPLSRQQLGDLLGLSIETVSRKLRDFERAGHIALPDYRSLILLDRPGLAALATV